MKKNQLTKRRKINQLRQIIREESYAGALQAQLRLQGYDKDQIENNIIRESLADNTNTTPLLQSEYSIKERRILIIRTVLLGIAMLLMFFGVIDWELVKLGLQLAFM